MSGELELHDHIDTLNDVVSLYLKGEHPNAIAKQLGMKRALVVEYLQEFKHFAASNQHIADRAREALIAADKHYGMVIKEAWDVVEEAGQNSDLRTKSGALRLVADVEQKRIDMLQKAGVLDNTELATQLAEAHRKQEMLIEILKDLCPDCKARVAAKLSRVTGEATTIVVVDNLGNV